jgi:hypothetical protein
MEALFEQKIPKLLEKHDISVSNDEVIYKQLAYHIYTMVFNICALIATNTLIHDKETRKVTPEQIKTSLEYVTQKCFAGKKQKGGTGNRDIYGSDALYQAMQKTEIANHLKFGGGISVFTIIFTKVLPEKELFPSRFIKEILSAFDVTISENALKHLKHVLKMHLSCLLTDLKKVGGELTPQLVTKVVKMKRHSVFL